MKGKNLIERLPINFEIAIILVIIIMIYGIIGSYLIMGLNIVDSLYYTIVTMTTVGYGDIMPTTDIQKIFSITLALGGVGLLAYVFTLFFTIISERMSEISRGAKMKRKIEALKDPYILCGYGRVGTVVLDELQKRNQNVILIEQNPIETENIEESDSVVVLTKDATDNKLLEQILNNKHSGVIISTGSDITNLFIVLSVREISPNSWIVVRSSKIENIKRLYNAGANKVIAPELSGGGELYFEAARPNLLRITVKHDTDKIFDEMETVINYGCTLESIDYHFPGIIDPLVRKIGVLNNEELEHFKKDNLEDKNKIKSLRNLYHTVSNIHSHWISSPDKTTLSQLIKELETKEEILGINLTDEEITEITIEYLK